MQDVCWLRLVLAALATWRLTHLLADEDGPHDAVVTLRRRLGDFFVGSLMDCFQCLSLWIAAPLADLGLCETDATCPSPGLRYPVRPASLRTLPARR